MKNKILLSLIGALLALSSFLMGKVGGTPTHPLGSVALTSGYQSTTTQNGTIPNYYALAAGSGILGQVTIVSVGPANSVWRLYDATSTVNNPLAPTTTMASFASNNAVGTYVFDSVFKNGLLIECYGGCAAIGSTTITWRKE